MNDLNHSRNPPLRLHARCFRHRLLLPTLITGLGLMILAGRATAQTFTTLHSFTGTSTNSSGAHTNSDGVMPSVLVILSGNPLYGTASGGGSFGHGTVFAVNTDGTGFTVLHSFAGYPSEGTGPIVLILSGNALYGTTYGGGTSDHGTVFAVNTNGTGFKTLHSFPTINNSTNTEGSGPNGGLIINSSGTTLYGTAIQGGSWGVGTVFALDTDGMGFTNLHSFTDGGNGPYSGDGAYPNGGLIINSSGTTLYGTATQGGSGNGTVFSVHTNGTAFTTLHSFVSTDGGFPTARLTLAGNILYGSAFSGGSSDSGTVFSVNTNGMGFTNLHSFANAGFASSGFFTNSDGMGPSGGLILSGSTLYGTAQYGTSSGQGTVFALGTAGTSFTNLHNFADGAYTVSGYTNSDGNSPGGGLILSGSTLYGMAQSGGYSGNGTLFSLSFKPQLTIISSAENVILTWPTNYAGFDYTGYALQSTTNLGSSAVWTTNSPLAVVVNGRNTATNPLSRAQQFFRLSQ